MSWVSEGTMVWSTSSGVDSTDGINELKIGGDWAPSNAIFLYNSHATTGAVIKLNDSIGMTVLIPGGVGNYIKIPGNYDQFEVVTAGVTVYAFTTG
jgi:hypothetical protein